MNSLLEFLSLQDPNVRNVVLGSVLISSSAAVVGCFTFLRKRSLVGDAVAHAVLPGVALAFMISQVKHPLILLFGAFFSGWLALLSIDIITSRSKIKTDTAIGLVLSVFFGIGILLLTHIQQSGNAAQSGLDTFLFGKAASLMGRDLVTFSIVSVVLLLVVIAFFKEFQLLSFDPDHARAIGLPVKMLEFILATITVFAIAVGIQAVGVVLMAALLITPAAAARYWSHKLFRMILLAAIFAAVGGISGSYVSYIEPNMPTGPWIVMFISFIAFFSLFLAPRRGLWYRWISKRRLKAKINRENILKAFYHLGEKHGNFYGWRSKSDIMDLRYFRPSEMKRSLRKLQKKGMLSSEDGKWRFTGEGRKEGQRIVRLHRLWELYLTEYLNIAPDHVHEDAEAIEHVITPEIEKKLEEILDYPETDPHLSAIPKKSE